MSKIPEFDLQGYKNQIDMKNMVSAGLEIVAGELRTALCGGCGEIKHDTARRRLNTMYAEDESNWLESCYECFEETIEHYRELWREVYS